MKKTLAILALSLSLAFSDGCTGQKARGFWRVYEVGQDLKNGLKNYYTKEERKQQQKELVEDMNYIHALGEKNKRN